MGKPIAGRNKSPFGVDGINVDAAVLADGTKLTNIRISKQRSANVFDLMSVDGLTLYPFIEITGVDKNGVALDVTATGAELSDSIAPGTFCISAVDTNGDIVGFTVKLLSNKLILQNGSVLFLSDYSSQGQVIVAVSSVAVSPLTAAIRVGATQQLTATIAPADATNKSVTWISSAPAIATVSASGLVSGVTNGTANVTVTSVDGSFTSVSAITVSTAVTGVTMTPDSVTLSIAGTTTQQLTSTVAPASASVKTVTYVSSDPAVATVSASGLVTAVTAGSATITVTTTDGSFTDTTSVTVTA
jgi:uncharacterized protein YjdB